MRLLFLLFAACLVAPFTARSQKVKVELANEREHFLAGENIPLTIRISNFSGRTLVLGNDAEWLSLTVTSPLGRLFIEYSQHGKLVPDEPTIELWKSSIEGWIATGKFRPEADTLVLDGIPRNAAQAKMLINTLDVRALLHLTCPDRNKMVERLQRRALRDNRLDDANLDVIRNRLQVYDQETKPVLDFYGPDVVHNINATQTPIEVLADILRILAKL